jgi:hypothetical protein
MDEDLRAALFDDDEEFEELADDFVVAASAEPEEGYPEMFDFEAHMARLIAASEAEMARGEPRGWEDGITYQKVGRAIDEESFREHDELDDEPVRVTTEDQRFIDEQFEKVLYTALEICEVSCAFDRLWKTMIQMR